MVMKEECIYKKYEPIFGSWYITKKLGEGAVATVYAMERHELGVTYEAALKAITIPESEDEIKSVMADGVSQENLTHYYQTIVSNVVNEFKIMSRLKGHSHIVSYEDHVIMEHEDDVGWDILMRIEKLTPLIEYSLEHPLQEADVLRLGIDICKALEYCRNFGIIHRDVKPENIFIGSAGNYKLGDFGIAKVVEETRVGLSRKGTYTYMAPEVYCGGPYGQSADIYSLGMIMYKYLNDGRNPLMPPYPEMIGANDYDEAFTRRISGEEFPEPAHGSRKLKKLIMKACSFKEEERFHSATEFRQKLEQLAEKFELQGISASAGSSAEKESFVMEGGSMNSTESDHSEGRFIHEDAPVKCRGKRCGLIASVIAAVVLLVAGCITYAAIPKEVMDITGINDTEELYIGDQLAPEYTIEPDWFKDEPIVFKMKDNEVATVDTEGVITASKVGSTILTLSAKEFSRDIGIEVVPKVIKIKGIDSEISLEEGSSKTLKPKLLPEKFASEEIIYKSSKKSVAKVSKNGKLTALAPGTATITIKAGGCTRKISVEVYEYVAPVQSYNYRGSSNSASSSKSSGSRMLVNSSSKSSNEKSSGSSSGYFDSGDDELF